MNGIEQSYYQFGKLSQYLNCGDLTSYINEIENAESLIREFEDSVKNVEHFKTKKFKNIYDFTFYRLLMYVIVRLKKPRVFIETGVMHGLTSSFILEALNKNKEGVLISIDYPSYFHTGPSNKDGYLETLPPNKEPGWIVSDKKFSYWDLKIGKSSEILPSLNKLESSIDIFLHDSEHSYETMWMEMTYAWEHLNTNGILLVDNIDNNSSFYDFCKQVNRIPLLLSSPNNDVHTQIRFGLILK
jgi:hypothetical protein